MNGTYTIDGVEIVSHSSWEAVRRWVNVTGVHLSRSNAMEVEVTRPDGEVETVDATSLFSYCEICNRACTMNSTVCSACIQGLRPVMPDGGKQ